MPALDREEGVTARWLGADIGIVEIAIIRGNRTYTWDQGNASSLANATDWVRFYDGFDAAISFARGEN